MIFYHMQCKLEEFKIILYDVLLTLPDVFHMNPKRNNTIDLLVTLYSDTVNGVFFFKVDLIEKGMQTPIIHMNLKSNYSTLQRMHVLYRSLI